MNFTDGHPALRTDILPRPRLERLLERGLEYPLITIVAPPGYGKTVLAASFIQKQSIPCAWIGLSVLDNGLEAFWKKLIAAFEPISPLLSETLENLGFPETIEQFRTFIENLKAVLSEDQPMIVVIDDYDLITNETINLFINRCANITYTEQRFWHTIIISNAKLNPSQSPFSKSLLSIGEYQKVVASDLAFDFEEARQLFLNNNKQKSDYQIKRLLDRTAGWPVYLQLLCKSKSENDISEIVTELFESEYYSRYDPDFKELLIKLALLPRFSLELLKSIHPDNIALVVEAIAANVFIELDYSTRIYRFQNPYHDFLASKSVLIDDAERVNILNTAGDWFFDKELYRDAQELYMASKNYEGLLNCYAIAFGDDLQNTLTKKMGKVLEAIPEEFTQENPQVDFYLGFAYLNNGQITKAHNTLEGIIKKHENNDEERYRQLCGEAHLFLANICLLQNNLKGLDHIKKAARYLPAGSDVVSQRFCGVGENSAFFVPKEPKVSVADLVSYIKEGTTYFSRISNGFMYGFEYLFEAEASTAIGDMKRAETAAEQAIQKAMHMQQHDIVFLGYFSLIRTSVIQGDYQKMKNAYDRFENYYTQANAGQLSDLRDLIHATFNIKIGNINSVAPWIKNATLDAYVEKPLWTGRNVVTCSIYALHEGDASKALSLLTLLDGNFLERGLWTTKVLTHIIKAVAYRTLNDNDSALFEFWSACTMSQPYGIFFPLAETGAGLAPLIEMARETDQYDFDLAWLDQLEEKSADYIKGAEAIIRELEKDNPIAKHSFTLSKREQYALSLLSRGLTREEMASTMGISVNGVKKQLSNIYKKLDAHNRSEAVYIASVNGIV